MNPVVTTIIGIATAAAVLAAGFTMFPPTSASAARPHAVVLGVDEETAVVVGPKVAAGEKFDGLTDSIETTAHPSLVEPSHKRRTKVVDVTGWKKAKASWYGPGLYGNGMAGGGKLKKNSMVVAHRSMPFGTKLVIKYKGKSVSATVKDRGPFIKGRIFDLGPGTAKALGFSGVGTITYKIVR